MESVHGMRHIPGIAVLLALFFVALQTGAAQDLNFVIRVDDIQSRSPISPRSLKPLEEAVEARGARLTYALIPGRLVEPQNVDGVLASELRSAAIRGHEISLHGYDHICNRCGQANHEMYCTTFGSPFTFEQQMGVVQAGLELVHDQIGLVPASFVPPGHVTDATTFEVLEQSAIPVVSTGDASANGSNVVNLAPSEEYTWALTAGTYNDQLTAALNDIRHAEDYFMLLLHDPFTRPGYENGLVIDWVSELLDSLQVEHGSSIRFLTLSEAVTEMTVGVDDGDELPHTDLSLSVYPNPIRERASIRWSAPQSADYRIRLFDVLGREVQTIASGVAGSGAAESTWDTEGVAAGSYVVRIETGGSSVSRSLVVLP
jgi:predicted deacetylase